MGAYVRDKNTSAKLCAKNAGAGRLMCEGGRGVFAGHYGSIFYDRLRLLDLVTCVLLQSTGFLIKRSMKIE